MTGSDPSKDMIDYDPHHWWRHLLKLRGGILQEIVGRLGVFTIWTVAVTWFHLNVHKVDVPATGHTLAGTVLSLLLVFRTNSSYDRFWEGRKLWGGIVNETRNLLRAAALNIRSPDLLRRLAAWTAVYPYAVTRVLRRGGGLGPAAAVLPPAEIERVMASRNAGLAVALRMSAVVAEARQLGFISDIVQMEIDRNVHLLIDYQGGCERIVKTPLPFAYMLHLRRTLIVFILGLPFALVESFGWATVPVILLIAHTFLGIEEIGVEIEEPFGTEDNDLPLEGISESIANTLDELVPWRNQLIASPALSYAGAPTGKEPSSEA
ncbi:bestrophin family protein [Archangium lansingense]|uniref:Bestrophin family ion channel n=1 Tax=Archangium lansingense TaxID=2995310 RepID=A0ABT4ABD7_9BACT|nr:bestrophin family ion channel [Archangium lansinium]MCY1078974.1 bestrophin family ion channel [Archangium lansinium]